MPIEKTVTKRPLESLRERENPWLKSTPQERLAAMAVIFQTHDDGKNKSPIGNPPAMPGRLSEFDL
jgi:hypothetical protein